MSSGPRSTPSWRATSAPCKKIVATCSRGTDFVDAARKVVGVGSVGTRAYVVLLEGRDRDDPLFLQVKEAGASVLEGYVIRLAPTSTTDTASWPAKG